MSDQPEPEYGFVAYIDEAGDSGLKRVRPIDQNGATEWMTLSAVVIRAEHESSVVDWVRNIRREVRALQGPELHFRNQSPTKSRAICNQIATLPVRCFCVASNKQTMRGHRNKRAEKIDSQDYFYNWLIRLLLERVTDACYRSAAKNSCSPIVRLEFSQRGGLRYSQTRAYLKYMQEQAIRGTTYLAKREINPACIDWDLMFDQSSKSLAGLQLADVVASAFYQAANTIGPNRWDTQCAELLKPVMWRKTSWADEGVILQPPINKARAVLSEQQKQIFRTYGYAI